VPESKPGSVPESGAGHYHRLLEYSVPGRRVAWVDLWLFAPLALPFFSDMYVGLIYGAHVALGLRGPISAFAPMHWVFVNIVGVLAVLWAIARIRLPVRELVLADAYGRVVVAALLVFWIARGATPVLAVFVATELAGAIYTVWPRRNA